MSKRKKQQPIKPVSWFGKLKSIDEQIPEKFFIYTNTHSFIKFLVRLASVSGDELILFILPVLVASAYVVYLAHGHESAIMLHHLPFEIEFLADLFGSMCVCALLEQIGKCTFRRSRPKIRKYNQEFCCVWGEWWSFPSGHTLRAAYIARWLFAGPRVTLINEYASAIQTSIYIWAVAVGLSRVMVARHHPSDVITGFVIGYAAASVLEGQRSQWESSVVKSMVGCFIAIQVWFMMLGPILEIALKHLSPTVSNSLYFFLGGVYFSFYFMILLLVMRELLLPDGRIYENGYLSCDNRNGSWVCHNRIL